jgi:hypothetical protein
MFDPADAPALEQVYRNYLESWRPDVRHRALTRERALGLFQEWTEVLSGRPDPTQH